MKKMAFVMMLLCFTAGWSMAITAGLIDDFESYSAGDIATVAADYWNTTGTSTVVEADGNKYLNITGTGYLWTRRIGGLPFDVDSTATLYFRVYAEAETADHAFGLTDNAEMTWYDQYGAYVRITGDTANVAGVVSLDGRAASGEAFVDDIATLTIGQWYNVWLVMDVTGNSGIGSYDIYCTADGVSAVGATPALTGCGFRKDYVAALTTFVTGTNAATNVRVDDVYLISGSYLGIPMKDLPHGQSVEQGTPEGTSIPVTLKWQAAGDPSGTYTVNPDIVDQYVFMTTGDTEDPNIYYVGATGVDPGTDDPASEYPVTWAMDTTYSWVVVEAINGSQHDGTHKPLLTAGVSQLSDVDPNNIVGPTWTYASTKSKPTLDVQPVDARVFEHETASFTVDFTSYVNPVTATWYQDNVALTGTETGVTIDTSIYSYSTLSIADATVDNEGKYYCVLSVDENSTEDDIQSATRLLIIKKELAEYNFEDDLTSSSENAAPTGVIKTVSLSDPNELNATVVDIPTYIDGIEGKAIQLDGSQFINFTVDGYPQAGPLDTLGDARGTDYEKTGFGRGMEQGSMVCWVKPSAFGAVYMNANANDDTHFGLTMTSATTGRMIVRGRNADDTYQELGTAAGTVDMTDFSLQDGKWHMLAATWQDSTMTLYVDGEQVATNSAGVPEKYTDWELGNILGASRTAGARTTLGSFYTGAVDKLCIYNYVIDAADIVSRYIDLSKRKPCSNHSFEGYAYNFDNSEASYCKVDLADFMMFAEAWLNNGLVE